MRPNTYKHNHKPVNVPENAKKKILEPDDEKFTMQLTDVARLFNLSGAAISSYNVKPKYKKGRYVFYDIREIYRELQRRTQASTHGVELAKANIRKANAAAEKQEILAAVVRNEYVPVEKVIEVWEDLTTIYVSRLTHAGKILVSRLAGKNEKEIKKIWSDFAESVISETRAEVQRYSVSFAESDADTNPET